jgi:hypothetical protein
VSRRIGKYRVGGFVTPGLAFFLPDGPIARLIYIGFALFGLWLAFGK